MLPKRKYVKSYVGMGVALRTYGQEKAIKLKIKSVLTTMKENECIVVGIELEDFESQKYRLEACNNYIELREKKYISPLFVYRNRKEVIQDYDNKRIDELTRRKQELTEKMKTIQGQYDYFSKDLADCNEKLSEAMKVCQNRKWNLKKDECSSSQDNN